MVGNGDADEPCTTTEKWQYTWEAQSHTPTLRLLLFAADGNFNPSLQCHNLSVNHNLSRSELFVTWSGSDDAHGGGSAGGAMSLRVPVPRLLVDGESPVSFRALLDHIEVKLRLLLPVDHPILSGFDSLLNLSDEPQTPLPNVFRPLVMESDVKSLSSMGEVDFYCRRCSFKLNRYPLRNFVEMPSVNWREVADNWFGACCCSFGGISEKLVIRYVNSYTCSQGICLLSCTSVTLCKDDLVEHNFPEGFAQQRCNSVVDIPVDDSISKATSDSQVTKESTTTIDAGEVTCAFDQKSRSVLPDNEKISVNFRHEDPSNNPNHGDFTSQCSDSNGAEDAAITSGCVHKAGVLENEDSEYHLSEIASKKWMPTEARKILGNQKSFLNGFLEDIFMARSSNLSKDIDWHEFMCPQCTYLLGAYPCCEGHIPVDGGVRLFKCYISIRVPVGGARDMFRKYTVDKMFANHLVECANDESTFRFVIRDLKTKSPVLQIVLLNQDTWSCSGSCSSAEDEVLAPKLQLRPIIKVFFSDCSTSTETELGMIEEWATKNSAEDIFMLPRQIQELARSLMSAKENYPPSCASLQSLILSSLQRSYLS